MLIATVRETDLTSNFRSEGGTAIGGLATGEKHTRRSGKSPEAGVRVNPSDFSEESKRKVKDTDVVSL